MLSTFAPIAAICVTTAEFLANPGVGNPNLGNNPVVVASERANEWGSSHSRRMGWVVANLLGLYRDVGHSKAELEKDNQLARRFHPKHPIPFSLTEASWEESDCASSEVQLFGVVTRVPPPGSVHQIFPQDTEDPKRAAEWDALQKARTTHSPEMGASPSTTAAGLDPSR